MNTFEQMIDRGHERVCFHHDKATGLRAIIAVHSTTLGNALGGTRRWHYATEADALYDVLRLSEGMTYKAAVSGLPMGGAKSVILAPSRDAEATEAEARAMGRFVETFGGVYIAAEDVGVDIQFCDWMATESRYIMGGESVSRGGDPSPFTARGVFNGMKATLTHTGRGADFNGLTVAIQGVGSVGSELAQLVLDAGGRVVCADIDQENLRHAESLGDVTVVGVDEILTTKCDVLAPCALGGVINGTMIESLNTNIICGGANNILEDPDEDSVLLQNAGITYAPDFVVNAGGLIHLAGLYLGMSLEELDQKNDEIEQTTLRILEDGAAKGSTHAAAIAEAKRRIAQGIAGKEQVHAG